jgi:hypothetical protein
MLIKINETGSIFNNAIEFIKERKNIKTSSKAAVEAILDYEGFLIERKILETKIIELRDENNLLLEKVNKTKKCIEFFKTF